MSSRQWAPQWSTWVKLITYIPVYPSRLQRQIHCNTLKKWLLCPFWPNQNQTWGQWCENPHVSSWLTTLGGKMSLFYTFWNLGSCQNLRNSKRNHLIIVQCIWNWTKIISTMTIWRYHNNKRSQNQCGWVWYWHFVHTSLILLILDPRHMDMKFEKWRILETNTSSAHLPFLLTKDNSRKNFLTQDQS
jgi:hypothetical protein